MGSIVATALNTPRIELQKGEPSPEPALIPCKIAGLPVRGGIRMLAPITPKSA